MKARNDTQTAAAAPLPAEVAWKPSLEALELGSSAEGCFLGWDYWKRE